jgi:short subunit fatty acids transporter
MVTAISFPTPSSSLFSRWHQLSWAPCLLVQPQARLPWLLVTDFWNLIPFTMQMVMVVITGHVVASARPTEKLTKKLARVPRSGRGAIVYIAVLSMTTSLLS